MQTFIIPHTDNSINGNNSNNSLNFKENVESRGYKTLFNEDQEANESKAIYICNKSIDIISMIKQPESLDSGTDIPRWIRVLDSIFFDS
jgi:hypothetical protein